jgi:hypothetical protein
MEIVGSDAENHQSTSPATGGKGMWSDTGAQGSDDMLFGGLSMASPSSQGERGVPASHAASSLPAAAEMPIVHGVGRCIIQPSPSGMTFVSSRSLAFGIASI